MNQVNYFINKFHSNKDKIEKISPKKLITQLGSLLLIVVAGPLIIALLFIRQGNL